MWPRNVLSLAAYNVFRGLVVGGVSMLLPMYMKYLGYSMNTIGAAVSAGSLALALILPLVGYLIDKYGSRAVIVVAGVTLLLSSIIPVFTGSVVLLATAYLLLQFSYLGEQPARGSFLAASVGVGRVGAAVGFTSSVTSAARTVGPLLAGLAAARLGFHESFMILGVSMIAGLAAFIALSEPVPSAAKPLSVKESYSYLLKPSRRLAIVLGFVSIDRFAWSLWTPMISAYLYAAGYTEEVVGYLITFSGVVRTILLPLAGKWVDRAGAWVGLAASEASGVIASLLFADPASPVMAWIATLFWGVGLAFWIPGYNSLVAKTTGGSGHGYAASNTARSLAGAPAPLAGGFLYDALAAPAPFLASTILLTAAIAYIVLLLKGAELTAEEPAAPIAMQHEHVD